MSVRLVTGLQPNLGRALDPERHEHPVPRLVTLAADNAGGFPPPLLLLG